MKSFSLEIVTPDHVFYTGPSESITVELTSGKMGILCNHEPVVAPLMPGEVDVRIDGKMRRAVTSGGFLEVLGDRVYMFVQSIEWVDEIDVKRAGEAYERAKRHLEAAKKEHNKYEIQRHIWALERAQMRLAVLKENKEHTSNDGTQNNNQHK